VPAPPGEAGLAIVRKLDGETVVMVYGVGLDEGVVGWFRGIVSEVKE